MNREELFGKSRPELLELCRGRGLAATAWKKEQMIAALQLEPGAELPAPAASPSSKVAPVSRENMLSYQLKKRAEESSLEAGRKARAKLLTHTGHCLSANRCTCKGYVPGGMDMFRWEICVNDGCGHTRWSHAVEEPAAAPPAGS